MKYMNHLRKLALLSSLALSYTVYADGTLPLPLEMTDAANSIVLKVNGVSPSATKKTLVVGGQTVQPCDNTKEDFYTATGTVTLNGDEDLRVLGVCQPKLDTVPLKRKILATNAEGSRITTLNGTANDLVTFTLFTGDMLHTVLVKPVPANGQESETSSDFAPVRFNLLRTTK